MYIYLLFQDPAGQKIIKFVWYLHKDAPLCVLKDHSTNAPWMVANTPSRFYY